MEPRLASNLKSSSLSFLSAGITGMNFHAQIKMMDLIFCTTINTKGLKLAGHWWLTPVILAEIRRTVVQSQPRQIAHKTLSQKSPPQKSDGGVVQSVDPVFKPQ
jgi:hypothetical protein